MDPSWLCAFKGMIRNPNLPEKDSIIECILSAKNETDMTKLIEMIDNNREGIPLLVLSLKKYLADSEVASSQSAEDKEAREEIGCIDQLLAVRTRKEK